MKQPKYLHRRQLARAALALSCAAGLASGFLGGCNGTSGGPDAGNGGSSGVALTYDFHAGKQGWEAGFSDLPTNYRPANYQLDYSHAHLPAPLDQSRKALLLTSHNRDDDLWYFLKRPISGLRRSTRYRVRFELQIASNAPADRIGSGGNEGLDVTVKAGASATEPQVLVRGGRREFSLDKGEQTQGGRDVVILGNIAIPGDEKVYALKPLDNHGREFVATTDSKGQLWAFFGTESGFEGLQTLYYTRLRLSFTPA